MLEEMLRLGMTGLRLNLSHITLTQAQPMLEELRKASESSGKACELLIDMQGPELRIGALPAPAQLTEGEELELESIAFPEEALSQLHPGQEILLDDGKLLLVSRKGTLARVKRGGLLQSRKSVALPGVEIRLPPLTREDRENIALAAKTGVTGVMQPFVRCREDLLAVREALDKAGGERIRLFAKIEDMNGVADLAELLPACDQIVIARGDLGNAMPLWQLPAVQKRISSACREAGKPFMVVTQMLNSMERNPVPTRAEVSDIFNAVLDGAASVMVTGETAAGSYPVEVIRYLVNTVRQAEAYRQELLS